MTMKANKKAEAASKIVINAYIYALEHKLDIKSCDDVTTILKVLDPDHAGKREVEAFIPVLGLFAKMTRAELAKRGK